MLQWQTKLEAMSRLLRKLAADEEGQSLTEYALILTLVAVVVAGVLTLLGKNVEVLYQRVSPALD